jgi:beta-glucosidase
MGARAYRFSISWSRVIPLGGRKDPVNQKGLQYYIDLVDELLANGIEPMVTLFHWDLPEELDQRYGGLLNTEEFVADFAQYSRTIFQTLGKKVKYWVTFNEPWCSSVGDSSTEPWLAGHNLLIAHGAAVKIYREEFKSTQRGQIGITLNGKRF